ncbi:hypothetical protein LTR66_004712, partial [Elasticomyces elasticus]
APAASEELAQLHPVARRMQSTLSASTGIMKGKTSVDLNIDMEATRWREEFGEREGERMEK